MKTLYGIYYQGSYWTGESPMQSLIRFFDAFPKYRITKNLSVYAVNRHGETNIVSRCYQSEATNYTPEELRALRTNIRKQTV
jgi:hypothetical protein